MKCITRCILLVSSVLLLIALLIVISFGFASTWLSVPDKLEKSDAIVILAGDPARAIYAADLYVQGYADKIYISEPVRLPSLKKIDQLGVFFPRQEIIYQQVLIKKGVPDSSIFFFGDESISTVDEAIALTKADINSSSLLIVTSPYHVKRTQLIFNDVLPDIKIRVIPIPYEQLPAAWWKDQNAARDVLLEVVKISHYLFTGGFKSKPSLQAFST